MARHSYILIIGFLIVLIALGGVVLYHSHAIGGEPLDIQNSSPCCQVTFCVTGEVNDPGIYTLDGSNLHISDAIEAAGGLTEYADPGALNLDAPLSDGDIIHVYPLGDAPQKIKINTAEAWLLDAALPGIGPTLAQRIVDYREENGPFQSIDELLNVDGIGPSTYEEIKDLVTVD